jgi:hypothetical protein
MANRPLIGILGELKIGYAMVPVVSSERNVAHHATLLTTGSTGYRYRALPAPVHFTYIRIDICAGASYSLNDARGSRGPKKNAVRNAGWSRKGQKIGIISIFRDFLLAIGTPNC